MGEFGDKFRKAREKKELSFDDVSNVTKISSRMLQAIEQEHFDQLPGGVFNKGFIRAYAKHLGLDPEEAVTDYLTTLRQAQIDAHEVWEPHPPVIGRPAAPKALQVAASPKPEQKPEAPVQVEELPELQLPRVEDLPRPRREFSVKGDAGHPSILIASIVVVIALIAFLWTRHSHPTASQTPLAAMQPTPTPQPAPPATTASSAAVNTPAAASATPAGSQPPPSKPPSSQPAPATQTSRSASSLQPSTKTEFGPDVTVRTFGSSAPKSPDKAATAAASLALTIRATETSWVSIQADGQTVGEETLIAPAHFSVHASREIIVRVGNAAGVNFIFNGKEIPAQGNESEVKTVIFDSSGLKLGP